MTIPSLDIDTKLESVGISMNGAVETPTDPQSAAWFNLGTEPGEIGTAVITGHFGWKDNMPAVFDDLHTLRKGDRIYVENEVGEKIAFIVRETKAYQETDDTREVFEAYDGKAHLNLITCGGTWDPIKKSYSHRIVVFADKEIVQ